MTEDLLATAETKDETTKLALESYSGATILITGGLGFLGSALVEKLRRVPCRIVLLVRPGQHRELPGESQAELKLVHGDLGSTKTWSEGLDGADYVFHFAGQTSTYLANNDPQADLQANVMPIFNLLESCRQQGWKPKVLFAGTVTQAGIPTKLPVDESFQDHPCTIYDIHKLAAEKYLQYYAQEEGIPTVTLRLSNVYGPGTDVGSRDRGVLNQMMLKGLSGEPLTVYGQGDKIRDYVFIDDVVNAFWMAGCAPSSLSGNYFLIGSGKGVPIVEAINLVADRVHLKTGRRPQVKHVPAPESLSPIEDRDFVANTNRFRVATGWNADVTLPDGIDRTLEFLSAGKSW